jgi:hypothetical protein
VLILGLRVFEEPVFWIPRAPTPLLLLESGFQVSSLVPAEVVQGDWRLSGRVHRRSHCQILGTAPRLTFTKANLKF